MKAFKIPGDQIISLTDDRRACIATDMITVEGYKVGYMYRDEPTEPADSGWRFLSGFESPEYMSVDGNHGVYAVNTIANYDPEILPLVDYEVGAEFERLTKESQLTRVNPDAPNP